MCDDYVISHKIDDYSKAREELLGHIYVILRRDVKRIRVYRLIYFVNEVHVTKKYSFLM